MASPKLVIRNTAGKIQFIAPAVSMQLVSKGSALTRTDIKVGNTGPSCIAIPTPPTATSTQIIATRAPFYVGPGGSMMIGSQNHALFTCDERAGGKPVDYWIFDYASNIPDGGGPGLRLRDPSTGKLLYNSNFDNLRIAATPNIGLSEPTDRFIQTLPAGKTYATIMPSMAGYNMSTEDLYIDGQLNREEDSGGIGVTSRRYQRKNEGKIWGTRWNGVQLEAGPISFDDVIVEAPGFARQPDPPTVWWSTPLNTVMVIDVTSI